MEIREFREFEFINEENQNVVGYIDIVEQNENTLRIRFEPKKHSGYFFSYDKLNVVFEGEDTLIFDEGCCDRWSYKFIRNK